jgi:hypothetical protein
MAVNVPTFSHITLEKMGGIKAGLGLQIVHKLLLSRPADSKKGRTAPRGTPEDAHLVLFTDRRAANCHTDFYI